MSTYNNLLYVQDLLMTIFLILSVIGIGMLWVMLKR
jgi:hypothetical protein